MRADGAIRNRNAVDVLNMGLNISGGHALDIHGQGFLLNILADTGLVLFQHLGLGLALAVSRNRHIHFSKAGTQ